MRSLVISAIVLLTFSGSLKANDEAICNAYGKLGETVASFMLPLTLQQMVNMNSGKDAELMSDFIKKMTDTMSGTEMLALADLGDDAAELLGEFGGQNAITLLMGGQATSSNEIRALMKQQCLQAGPEALVNRMRKAKRALKG